MSNGLAPTVMFGHPDGNAWGVASVTAGGSGYCAFGDDGSPAIIITTRIDGTDSADPWQLAGEGIEFEVVAESEPGPLRLAGAKTELQGFEQLCRVRGSISSGGVERAIDCLGCRGAREQVSGAESIRELAAWFGDGEGLAVVSVRNPGSSGHAADTLGAVVFEAGQSVAVEEPRLSTTYRRDGAPTRASLELWLAPEEGDDDSPSYARRAVGEAVGPGAETGQGEIAVRAEPFRWYMRGRTGTGVYQLTLAR